MSNFFLKIRCRFAEKFLKSSFTTFIKKTLLDKNGIEIGGPSNIFKRKGALPVYIYTKKLDNCLFNAKTLWSECETEGYNFIFESGKAPGFQYIREATDLHGIADETYDFLLSSHCIEHIANPLKALIEWKRILKDEALIVLVIPHKDGTFDHRRPTTALDHIIEDFRANTTEADTTHITEALELHDVKRDPGVKSIEILKKRFASNMQNRSLHHHVFDLMLALRLTDAAGIKIIGTEVILPHHIIIIGKKCNKHVKLHNEPYFSLQAKHFKKSPFISERLLYNSTDNH